MDRSEVYTALISILRDLANKASEGCAYKSWDSDYARKTTEEAWLDNEGIFRRKIGRRFTFEKISLLNEQELHALGFFKWDEAGLRLVPLWVYNYIADGEEFICINGKRHIKGTDNINLDTRMGAIAYGFYPSHNE